MSSKSMREDMKRGHKQQASEYQARYQQWIRGGQVVTPKAAYRVMDVIENDLTTSDRSDGSERIRPSMCGTCVRAQWYSYQGAPNEFSGNELTLSGTFSHYRWQLAGLSDGWLEDIEVPVSTPYGLRGSMDGITTNGEPFELKTTNYRTFKKVQSGEISQSHLLQVAAYMEAVDADRAVLVYEERGMLNSWAIDVHQSDELLNRLHSDAEQIKAEQAPQVLSSCNKMEGKEFERCNYKALCRPWEAVEGEVDH